jgi:hypothetical protein
MGMLSSNKSVSPSNLPINNVFVSPWLASNLILVGRLVDNNCDVKFSRLNYFMQDQVSRKWWRRDLKVGRLFLLQFHSSSLSFAINWVI